MTGLRLAKVGLVYCFGLAGILCILFATSQSVGLSPDSADYICAGRSLLSTGTFRVLSNGQYLPLTWYPPLFPTILAAPGLFGIDPLISARWVNALFFGATVVLISTIVARMSRASYLASLVAAFLILTSTELYENHVMAWSEPGFIFFAFSGLAMLAFYLHRDRWWFLVLAAVFIGLAVLTRYVGVVLLFVCAISLFALSRKKRKDRLLDTLLFSLVAAGPIALWLVRNHYVGASAIGGRSIGVHPVSVESLSGGLKHISSWFLPSALNNAASGGLVLTWILILALLAWWRTPQLGKNHEVPPKLIFLFPILAMFIASYLAFLIFSISFVSATTPIDNRILAPIYVALVATLVAISLARLPDVASILSFCLLAIVIGLHLNRATAWLAESHSSGPGRLYASQEWRGSPVIQYVRSLPDDATIFSNGPDAIYLLANRISKDIPRTPMTDADIAELNAGLHEGNAHLVYFALITWRDDFPRLEELKRRLNLRVDLDATDGQVLGVR
jgi:4-amino-4-deoxy-L-arabinose transferase-like glycosyltransferase